MQITAWSLCDIEKRPSFARTVVYAIMVSLYGLISDLVGYTGDFMGRLSVNFALLRYMRLFGFSRLGGQNFNRFCCNFGWLCYRLCLWLIFRDSCLTVTAMFSTVVMVAAFTCLLSTLGFSII